MFFIYTISLVLLINFFNVNGFITKAKTSLSSSSIIRKSYHRSIETKLSAVETFVIDPSYNLALGSLAVGLAFCNIGNIPAIKNASGLNLPGKIFNGLTFWFVVFGSFIAFQTTTLRFQFDETSFSLVKTSGESIGENVVVGGENSWKYDKFINWAFLPNDQFPILVYFKEIQTPKENWIEAPIVVDNEAGQPHYFPAIARVDQLKAKFQAKKCKQLDQSQNSFKTQLTGSMY